MENSRENGDPRLSSISTLSETAAMLLSTKQRPDFSGGVNAAALMASFITTTTDEGWEGHTEESVSREMSSNGYSGDLSTSVQERRGLKVYALSTDALELVREKDATLANELNHTLAFKKNGIIFDTQPSDNAVHVAVKTMVNKELEAGKELKSSLLDKPPQLNPVTADGANPVSQFPCQRYGTHHPQTPGGSRVPAGWLIPGPNRGNKTNKSSPNSYAFNKVLRELKNEEAMDEEEATQRAAIALALVKHSPVGVKGVFGFKKVQNKGKFQPSSRRKNVT